MEFRSSWLGIASITTYESHISFPNQAILSAAEGSSGIESTITSDSPIAMIASEHITLAAQDYFELCQHAASSYPWQDPVLVAAARRDTERVRELLEGWHRSQGHPLPQDTDTQNREATE
jgi:hypothetical protein